MKKNMIYTGVIIVMCIVVIWLAVLLAWPAGAAWVPPVSGYDLGVDYMAEMVKAAEDGGEWAMAMGQIYEAQRNAKIKDLGLEYETTDFFGSDNAKTVLEKLREYIALPEPEDERVGWQSLGVWDITAYTWTGNPCANGEYPHEGLCAVNGLPFGAGSVDRGGLRDEADLI